MIKESVFIKSITQLKDQPIPKPQILLLGRSNVGKSSFINAFAQKKQLARVSKVPGKTITLNYYEMNQAYYLVDAPGYGYAKRSKQMQDEFVHMIESFILNQHMLKVIILFVDFKVGPTALDQETYQFLKDLGHPIWVVCTKYDQIPKTRRFKQEKAIALLFKDTPVYYISNETKENMDRIRDAIEERMKEDAL